MTSESRWSIEVEEKWREWVNKIPPIKFDPEWEVKVIPPFSGAMARFQVESNGNFASVYLDCYDRLGYFGSPYWEVYPVDGDCERCSMNDTDTLVQLIRKSLEG